MSARRPPTAAIVIVALLVIAAGLWWWLASRPSEDQAGGVAGLVEVDEYLVSPATAGRITAIEVKEGTQVSEGQKIAALDGTVLALQLTQAEAGVTAAKAQVTNAEDNGTDADVTAAKAQVAQAQAAVDLVKAQQGYTVVKAPHAGVVTSVTATAGQNASPGTTLARIVDPAAAFVRAYVPEPRLGEVKVGQEVTITPSAAGSTTGPVKGAVEYVASQAEFTPNNVQTPEQRADLVYEVRIRLQSGSEKLTPGLPVDVALG